MINLTIKRYRKDKNMAFYNANKLTRKRYSLHGNVQKDKRELQYHISKSPS